MKTIGKYIGYIFLLFCLLTGAGYFLPSLFYETAQSKQSEKAFITAYKKTVMPSRVNDFIDYEAYLSQKLNRLLISFTGNEAIKVFVNADLTAQTKQITTEEIIPNSAVVASETTTQTTENEISKTVTYTHSKIQTHTSFTQYSVRKMNVLVFLGGTPLHTQQRTQIEGLIQGLIGFNKNKGDKIHVVVIPNTFNKTTLFGISLLALKQAVAFGFICLLIVGLFLFLIPVIMKKTFPCSCMKHLYRQATALCGDSILQISDTNLLNDIRHLCATTPDLAVRVIRRWLMENTLSTNKTPFSPAQQAAILLLTLNENTLKKILRRMSADESCTLTRLMSCLGQLKADEIQTVLTLFMRALKQPTPQASSPELKTAQSSLPLEKAELILQELNLTPNGKTVWNKLEHISAEQTASFLEKEYPQTIAVILYHLSDEKAGAILTILPTEVSTPALMRLTALKYVSSEKIRSIENSIEKQFFATDDKPIYYGYQKASAILSLMEHSAQKRLMASLLKQAPQTARKLSQQIICFDDIALWSDENIRQLIKQTPQETLIQALAGAQGKTKEAFSRNIAPKVWGELLKRLSTPQTGKIKEIDSAQCFMIKKAQKMIENGRVKRKG